MVGYAVNPVPRGRSDPGTGEPALASVYGEGAGAYATDLPRRHPQCADATDAMSLVSDPSYRPDRPNTMRGSWVGHCHSRVVGPFENAR